MSEKPDSLVAIVEEMRVKYNRGPQDHYGSDVVFADKVDEWADALQAVIEAREPEPK